MSDTIPNDLMQKRFEAKFTKAEGCWLWHGATAPGGYGSFGVPGRTTVAHRVAYELYVGTIPEGTFVLHKCDTPACVNPDHLFLGSHQDNMRDKWAKGRQSHVGQRNPKAKLTEEDVLAIRADPRSYTAIAEDYPVTSTTIGGIKRRERWTYVTAVQAGVFRNDPNRR